MAMVVKNNMSAVSTLNTLNKNSSALQKSLQKVSSGMKINSAQDDASGYAISEKMRVQIRSLDQANQNTQNASSMMKTAEGAVSSTVEILKSLKEKAINAATDTNTDSDRKTIQKEIDQFIDQIDDNALTTFNGKYLVDGSKSQYGDSTYTKLTNQSLQTGTNGATALTALKNRNNESLEIEKTDYVTASYVKNGKTFTTKFGVSTNTLEDIFKALDGEGKVFANATGTITDPGSAASTSGGGSGDSTVGTGTYTRAELENIIAGGTTFDATDAKQQALYAAYAQDSSGTDAAALGDGSSVLGKAVDDAAAAISADIASNIAVPADINASAPAGSKGVTSIVYGDTTTPTSVTLDTTVADAAGVVAAAADDIAAAAKTAANGSTGTANGTAISAAIGTVTATFATNTAPSYSTTSSVTAASLDQDNLTDLSDAALELKAAQTLFGTTAGAGNAKTIADEIAGSGGGNQGQTDAAAQSDIVMADTFIGKNSAGDDVNTADGTEGLTISSAQKGIQEMVAGVTISITDSEGNVKKSANAALDDFKTQIYAKNPSDRNELTFQVGAAANQSITVGLDDMRAEALGLKSSAGDKVSVATQDNANAAVAVFDNAIQKALDQQTTIGAVEARLEYTSNNLTTSSENVQAAESTIRDADMAKEMTAYTKNNVLLQAAQSMLAQANQSSSQVLSLLQ